MTKIYVVRNPYKMFRLTAFIKMSKWQRFKEIIKAPLLGTRVELNDGEVT